MQEIEKLQTAKTYIEKLANGINPLTDTQLEENDSANNVRLSRCFFYIADILRQVLENGGAVAKRRASKLPFYITDEALERFEYSDVPISLTHIVARINALVDLDSVHKLSFRKVVLWLKKAGLLENCDGKYPGVKTCPTLQGEEIGLCIEKRISTIGEYFAVYYNRNAQEFIVNHIQSIAES